ncbi:hypothetical protein FKM82_002076 [Ascaphus truei]
MENYFEEETCNLDKVLDEFEKNEAETVSPRLLDTKWNQILNPPSLRVTDSPALGNVSKSIITIDANLKVRSPSLSPPLCFPCANGEIGYEAPEMPTMVTSDPSMGDDQLANSSGQPEIMCSTAAERGDDLHENVSGLTDVTLNNNCEKRTLLGESLSDYNNPTSLSLMDSLYFGPDSETPAHDQLSVTDNNEKLGIQLDQRIVDCSTVFNVSADTETSAFSHAHLKNSVNISTDSTLSEPGIAEVNITSQGPAVESMVLSVTAEHSIRRALAQSTEHDVKTSSCQSGDPDMRRSPVDGTLSKQQLKACVIKEPVNVTDREHFTDAVECVPDEEGLHRSASSELVVEQFSDLCVINGEFNKTIYIEADGEDDKCPEMEHCHAGWQHEKVVDANVCLQGSCMEDVERQNLSETNGTNTLMCLSNGCDSYGMQNPAVAHIPKSLPSKEDSVTEEKEIEECKSEYYANVYEQQRGDATEGSGLVLNSNGDQMKNHLHSLCNQVPSVHGQTSPKKANSVQSLSVPYGGARPKQPTHLKLPIPKPLSDMLQCDLVPPNAGCSLKNKNDVLNKSNKGDNLASDALRTESVLRSPVTDTNGELPGDYRGPGSPCLASTDSPDNDLLAGQFGVPVSKPFSTLGEVAPVWVPDSHAPNCMKCKIRFTFTKRRHHCRACGKVFCATCCSLKCKLLYMDKKEARVCVICHSVLLNAQAWENLVAASVQSPNPNNPAEYCSTIPPMQQVQASGALGSPPPTVMVPVGVLKHPGAEVTQPREQRRVWFADGILPNGEAADAGKVTGAPAAGTLTVSHDASNPTPSNSPPPEAEHTSEFCSSITQVGSAMNLIPEDGLPPILISTGVKGDYAVEEFPSPMSAMQQLDDGGPDPLVFVLNANLLAMVKIVNYVNRKCWCFTTKGMHAVGQAEIVILLQCLPDEKCLPRDVFCHFVELYREALAVYPCPLFSVRFRKPLFGETGHTIINVLADFRNYQYTLPVVLGLVVDMEVKKTSIKIPSNRYNEMMKAMNKSNDHVLAGGSCFNQKADSHLVCVQNEDGNYQTQAISIHKQPRKVTGASFFVFSGALKTSSGFLAKSSIVEDGVMVQITAESMDALRQALREMKDFTITCGKADAEENQEHVHVQWVEDDKNFNKGVSSPIDGKSMESVTSVKIFHGSEYKANGKIIRWTEVFFLDSEEQQSGLSDPADHSRLTENVAKAFCLALCPHLKLLKEDGMTRLGLRVTLDSDQVGYQAGSNGQPLPSRYTNDLDSALVPVIHGGTCQLSEGPVTMELLFYILENIS